MISSEDLPEGLAEWITEHAEEHELDLMAINTAIVIYEGFDSEGDPTWNYLVMSDDSVWKIIGLMEVAKTRMMAYQISQSVAEVQNEQEDEE